MRKFCFLVLVLGQATLACGQFSTDQLRLRIGYNVHNTRAKQLNHLITEFNNDRYPNVISENLPSVNFPKGLVLGVGYALNPDLILHAEFKSRSQFIEAPFVEPALYRKYLFRATTLELGASIPINDEGRVTHLVGGGLLVGVQSAFTAWEPEEGRLPGRNMLNIDRSDIIGLSMSYEARIELLENVHIFFRPVLQYSLNSNLRKLNQFFNPQFENGEVIFPEGEGATYDKGNFNGLGLEGGLQFVLPRI